VSSAALDRHGSVYTDLDVPDLIRGLWISNALIAVSPAVPSAGAQVLKTLVPVVPSATREFGSGDEVTAFVRVSQSGRGAPRPVNVRTTITNAFNATVWESRETMPVDRFTTARIGDYQLALPVAILRPGPHLLTFRASAGSVTVRRDVQFTVK
jgi:hypothetical protein